MNEYREILKAELKRLRELIAEVTTKGEKSPGYKWYLLGQHEGFLISYIETFPANTVERAQALSEFLYLAPIFEQKDELERI